MTTEKSVAATFEDLEGDLGRGHCDVIEVVIYTKKHPTQTQPMGLAY